MSIERNVQLVESLFDQLEQEIAQFRQSSSLSCVSGCGRCCTYPDIEASPLEFLPWAFHLFLKGEAEATLEKLNKTDASTCIVYQSLSNTGQGRCSDYPYRGLICRLFGFAANKDKYGSLRLATCQVIKDGQAEKYQSTTEAIDKGLYVPVFTDYYMRLKQIDFQLGNAILPINKALKEALEAVLQYYAYRAAPGSEK